MKKILTGILATIALLACAAGCGQMGNSSSVDESVSNNSVENESSVVVDDDLQTAAEFLESKYKKQNTEVRNDYTIDPMVMGYPISWTVDVSEGVKIVVSEDGKTVTVDVDENLSEDLTYVLTATLSSESGATTTVSFTRKVLAALAKTPVAITAAPVEGTAYKYHVYQSTKQMELYFAGGMSGYYFSTTESYEEAVDLFVEYVDDTTFNIYFNHTTDGKQYLGVRLSDDGAHDNIVYTSTPVSSFVWNANLGTVTTHLEKNKNGEPADYYFGNYSTHTTISASMISYAGGAGNNVGHLVEMLDKSTVPAAEKVAFEKDALSVDLEYVGDKSVTLSTLGLRYSDVTISWAVEAASATLDGNVLTITAPEAETTIVLLATISCGDVSETKIFNLTSKPAVDMPPYDTEITIPQANAIGESMEANVLTEGKYYVSGTVTEVKNTTYGNLYIQDADGNSLYIYGCYDATGANRYDAMTNAPQVGDTVKLYSAITSYNGSAQLKDAWVVEWTAGEGGNENGGNEEGGNGDTPVVGASASLSFADTANRVSVNDDQQVWSQNGITLTNDKAESTQPIKDYSNPVRLYANTSVTIECANMTSISIEIDTGKPMANLTDSLTAAGIAYTVDGNVCTITFAEATNSVTFSLVAQVRVKTISVTVANA